MLKILLTIPYITSDQNLRQHAGEPTGLLYLATYANQKIKEAKYNIKIDFLDLLLNGEKVCIKTKRGYRSGMSDANFEKELLKCAPDIIGISNNYTNNVVDILEICKTVKRVLPNCKIILGGANCTIVHEKMIKNPEIDLIARGEGEETFWEVLEKMYLKKSLANIKGITLKNKGKIKINPDRPLISDLDTLPIPDRSLIDYKKYYSRERVVTTTKNKRGNIISSRGCPYNCIFCSTQKVWRNKWRPRTPENIMKEIRYLNSTYGINEICFQDDQFPLSRDRVVKLCNLIKKSKLNIQLSLPTGFSPFLLDPELIEILYKTGFYAMTFSVDVGTEEARKFVRKPVDLAKVRPLVKKANSLGMQTVSTFVIGYPHEKKSDIAKTVKYAYGLHTDFANFYIAQAQVGSELYDILEKRHRVDDKVHDPRDTSFGTDHISAEDLMEITDSAMYGYVWHYLIYMIRNPKYFFEEILPKISTSKKLYSYFKLVFMWYFVHNFRRMIGTKRFHQLVKNIRNMFKNKA